MSAEDKRKSVETKRITEYAQKVDDLLKDMVHTLFTEQPADPLEFMIEYLTKQKKNRDAANDDGETPDAEPEEEEPEPDPVPKRAPPKTRTRRTGISAESSDQMSSGPQERVVHPKSDAAKEGIRKTVQNNILFNSLERSQLDIVVDAMFEQKFKPGEAVITQGAEGDNFFIVEAGTLECFVKVSKEPNAAPLMVKTYGRGDSFGELALMYNCPRAATIKAKTASSLWALDRVTFRSVLMDTTSGKRKRYEAFLEKVDLLSSLDKYERSKIADALVETSHAAGDVVIRQGDTGDHMYFIESGVCRATKVIGGGAKDFTIDLKAGQYFGELALLNDAPRAASVVAVEACVLASLDRACFARLLGPCDEILKRNAAKYSEYEAKSYDQKLAAIRGTGGDAGGDDGLDAATLKKQTASRRRRASVSSESMNMKNFDSPQEKLETFPKSDAQRERILASISKNFLFSSLDKTQIDLVIDTMREMKFTPGQNLITQGDTGDFFYVVDAGVAECFIKKSKDEAPIKVKTYNHGDSFGELALMYNCPRAATITAKSAVTVWAMERVPFRRILCETTSQRRKSYEGFLESIPLLSSLDRYERAKVSDALQEMAFSAGDLVIKLGDTGDNFYIIEDGEAVATKPNAKGQEVELMKYARGSYFGELALLQDVPRAANVKATTDLKTIYLDRAAFVRLLGPCDEILKRNADNYSKMQARLG